MRISRLYSIVLLIIIISQQSCFKKENTLLPYSETIDIEDNNSFFTANSFTISNEPIVGFFNTFENSKDIDFFKINFKGKAGAFRFTLTGVPGVNSKVTVYDINKKLLYSMDERGVGEAEIAWRYYSPYSELYVSIESTFGSNEVVPYIFTIVSEDKDTSVEVEPNNLIDDATFIEPGLNLKGYIVPASDIDYFKLVFNEDGVYDFRVKAESLSSVDLKLEIADVYTEMSVIIDSATAGGTEISQRFGSDKGSYVFKVSGEISDSSKEPLYYITVETFPSLVNNKSVYYEREFNNTIDASTLLIAGEDMIGTSEKDDIDYYALNIVNTIEKLNISVDGILDRKFTISVIDANAKEYYKATGTNNITIRDLDKGRYYIVIVRDYPGSFLYKLFYTTY